MLIFICVVSIKVLAIKIISASFIERNLTEMKKLLLIIFSLSLYNYCDAQLPDNKNAAIYVEQMPEFPGGQDSLISFLARNIHYPEKAKSDSIQGKVVAKFIINTNGTISDATILYDIGGGCGDEVLRVLKLMPVWKAGRQNGRTVAVYYNLPVAFYLDDYKKQK